MRFSSWTLAGSIAITGWFVSPVQAQIPFLQELNQQSNNLLNQRATDQTVSSCIRLNGSCVFRVAAQKSALPARREEIQANLSSIFREYLQQPDQQIEVEIQEENNLPVIYVNGQRLMTVTQLDANQLGRENPLLAAQTLERRLPRELREAQLERQPDFLARRGGIAAGIGVAMLLASLAVSRWERKLKQSKKQLQVPDTSSSQPISTQLYKGQQWNLQEVQHRLLQLVQVGIWTGGTIVILGLFPYTRIVQVIAVAALRIPLRVGIVGLGTYLLIRLTYALIDRFNSVLASNSLLSPQADRRLQLRIATITSVTRSIATISWVAVGFIVALIVVGIDVGPLLAGAGIVGVALSLASQNLIKDVINGFLIILEDQYGVGDVIAVGDVGGFVENINLSITQLRDAEGRLITVPNSEIRIISNLSSHWSRADLSIPVAYHADVDKALELVEQVAQQMNKDKSWRTQILEPPLVLGVDNFGEQGFIIRVWIKTQPLKQWDVSREFRRRIKAAFDEAGITLSLSRQEVWLNGQDQLKSLLNGDREKTHDGTKVL